MGQGGPGRLLSGPKLCSPYPFHQLAAKAGWCVCLYESCLRGYSPLKVCMLNLSFVRFILSQLNMAGLPRALWQLLMLFLITGVPLAHAAIVGNADFVSITQTTTGGTVAAGGSLVAGLTFNVKGANGDAIRTVQLMDGQTPVYSKDYDIYWGPDQEYVVNTARTGTFTANLSIGVHQLSLRVFTVYDTAPESQRFTVTVKGPAVTPVNAASITYQTIPATMIAGSVNPIAVMVANTGNTSWNAVDGYRLGSQNPAGTAIWGQQRLGISGSVAPGQSYLFYTSVTAPSTPGTYNMQWQMLVEGVAWFGAPTQNVAVVVKSQSTTTHSVSNSSPAVNESIRLTANVSGYSPTGTVTFKDGATPIATVAVSGGVAIYDTAALSAGAHSISASYSGDAQNTFTDSVGATVIVKRATSTAVAVNNASPTLGATVRLTATIANSSYTYGAVTFKDGGSVLGTVWPNGATTAFLDISSLAAGPHTITAFYAGDDYSQSSTSAGSVVNVFSTTTTTLGTSSTAPASGAAVTLTASVAGSNPTGDVQFIESGTVLATVPLTGGVASYSRPAMSTGLHTLTARYVGNAANRESTSTGVAVTWDKANASATLAASDTAPTVGSAVTFTATIAGSSPTGNVTFLDGVTSLGTMAVSGGSASVSTSSLGVGAHSITASYSGDANNKLATSGIKTVNVFSTSTTVLAANTSTPAAGAAVTFTATVTGSSPTGNVEFKDGATTLSTVALSGSTASYASPALSAGLHTISARYLGNTSNLASNLATVGVTWDKTNAGATLVASNVAPAVGTAVTFTATITGNGPTGNVTFLDGTTTLGTASVSGGIANFATSGLAVGAHSITASYAGDGNNKSVTSAASSVNVFSMSATNLSASTTSPVGGAAVTFTASVTGSNPTGNVQFKEGATVLGTIALSGGTANYVSPALSSGLHTIYARYVGNATNLESTSANVGVTWEKTATSTVLNASSTTTGFGDVVLFAATVTGNNPNGNVSFMDGPTTLGVVAVAGGRADLSISTLAIGSHAVTAAFGGDANNKPSNTAATTVTVGAASPPSSAMPLPVLIDAPYLANPDAGTLPGELSVSNSGAAAYSIPLVVPPGTAGLQPGLSLSYSGQGPNGRIGLGWSLGGMSSIHRCGKTIAQDGANDRIKFANTDRLCLDGQRLVLVNLAPSDDNYWAMNAEYRTEIDNFSRITVAGTASARSFKVEHKDGRIVSYGKGSSYVNALVVGPFNGGVAAIAPTPKVGAQSWAIDRIEDRAKNFISFAYEQDPATGEHRPTFIRYGAVGLPAHAAVQFVHQTRPDEWKRYIDETRNDLRSRISSIKTYVGNDLQGDVVAAGTLVRNYTLAYEQSPTSGRSLLTSVKACANNPQTALMECLPETTFNWGKPNKTAGFKSLGFWAGAPDLTTHNPEPLSGAYHDADHADYFAFNDFDGNGRSDVLEKRVASVEMVDMAGEGRYREWGNPISPGTRKNQYRYFHNTGTGFANYTYKLSTGEDFVVLDVGDFNGDGALDLFSYAASGTRICLSPLANPAALGPAGSTITFACGAALPAGWGNKPNLRPYVFDAYGDGRSAVYSNVNDNREATFCTLYKCEVDTKPPTALELNVRRTAAWQNENPEFDYTSLTSMVDFAGLGKPYDVRWTEAKYAQVITDWDAVPTFPQWELVNTTPLITMTTLGAPRSDRDVGAMNTYVYPDPPVEYGGNVFKAAYLFDHGPQGGNGTVDLSGSGYNGLVFGFLELGWNASNYRYNKRAETTLCQSTGRALDCTVRKKFSGDQYRAIQTAGNFVGDGQTAIMVRPLSTANSVTPTPTGAMEMCRVLGEDTTGGLGVNDSNMACAPWAGVVMPHEYDPQHNTRDQVYFMDLLGTGRTQLVYYHRGSYWNGIWTPGAGWEVFEPIDVAAPGEALDRIVKVTNGVGATASVEYVDGLTSGVVTRTGTAALSYPLQASNPAGKIVRRLIASNGSAADRSKVYAYQDAATDVSGRGSLGYRVVTEKDEQTNTTTTSTYAQAWPQTGMQLATTIVAGNGVLLSDTVNVPGTKLIPQLNGTKTAFVFTARTSVCRRDLNGDELGRTVVSGKDLADVQYDDWGNLLDSKSSLQSCSDAQTVFSTSVANTYWPIDTSHWLIGQVKRNLTTKYQRSDGGSMSRTVDFAYEPNFSGRIWTTTQEPGDLKLQAVTTLTRNSKGLVETAETTWTNPADAPVDQGAVKKRTVRTTYDANGRYPATVTNTLGHVETYEHYPSTGVRSSTLDANGMPTTWQADGFGRVSKMKDAAGNETRNYVKACQGACPLAASIVRISDSFHGTDRIAPPKVEYIDNAGHMLRSQAWGAGGRVTVVDQRYDALGRLEETDHPRFIDAPAYRASRLYHDDLNRVWKTVTQGEHGEDVTSTTAYKGLLTELTNPLNLTRKENRNVAGQLKSVVDTAGKLTQFGYDPFANLTQTIDPNGNVITVAYDKLGRKTDLIDPNLGWIKYKVDPIGQVYEQVSPKQRAAGEKTTFIFDDLGRMTERNETDLHSVWVFDTANKGKGQLAEAYTGTLLSKTYQRTHQYDSLGRPGLTTQLLTDGSYTSEPGYDGWGRLITQTYRRGSSAAKVFAQRYDNMGTLSRIERGSLVLWQAKDSDAAGRLTEVALGNGLKETQFFNPHTGRLDSSALNTTGGEMRLTEGYEYDAIGSVKVRSQYWSNSGFQENLVYDVSAPHNGFRETFTYDNLNRIDTSQVDQQALQEFKYDDAGNMLSKTGVGTGNYQYPVQGPGAVRPHAVNNIPGIGQFLYDDNGNLVSGAQRTVVWSSFDMPNRIEKMFGAVKVWANFVYGPEHQRTRQDRSDGSQVVYAGAQEIEAKGGQTTVKTYWPGRIGLEVDKPNGTTELNWTHTDRMGSPIGLTDQNGTLREKLAYDAWGKRRTLAGASVDGTAVPDGIDGTVDNRGYTGHEMLDQLDLVHMNGRVYDPLTARFMSADPLVGDPMNGQNYNRYSYVLNNPTNLTDPTGFDAQNQEKLEEDKQGKKKDRNEEVGNCGGIKGTKKLECKAEAKEDKAIADAKEKSDRENAKNKSANSGTGQSGYDKFSQWAHVGLSGAGAVPGLGIIPDAIDFVYTAAELPFGKSSGTDVGLAGAGILATVGPGLLDGPAAAAKIAARLSKFGEKAAPIVETAPEIGTIVTRTTKNTTRLGGQAGEPGLKITYKNGTEFDMTASRVKQTELNPYVPGGTRPVKFQDAANKQGTKRAPTKEELDWFNSLKW